MGILVYDVIENEDKYVFKSEIHVVCWEFLAVSYVYICFFQNKSDDWFLCTSEILKTCV